jgi:TolB protein
MVILAATLALTPSETKSATIDLVDSNGRIAFVGYSSSHAPAQLYVVNSNGSGLKPLANVDGFTSDDRIAWSPDGQKIAVPRAGRANGLYIVKVNGSGQTKLVSDADWPAWSPDGKKIAFARPGGIYVINTDGSGLRRLIANHGRPSVSYYSAPSWSPDGTKIAFGWYGNCRAPGGPTFGCSKIEIASSDGSSTKTLIEGCPPDCATTNPPPPDMRGAIADPAWSPDGAKIAFRWDWCACTPRGRDSVLLEIGVVNSNGSGVKRLTAVQPPVANWQPAWSPDGTKIVFGKVPCFPKALCFPHEGYAGSTLYVMNASGSNQHKLVGGLDSAFAPAWQPSGERPVPVPSSLSLAPRSQTNDPGAHATVTATVVDDSGKAVPGVTVYFAVTTGPNVGTTGSAETDGHGRASFSYTSSTTGIDTLSASFVDHGGNVHRGNSVTITWQIGTPPPTCSTSSLTFGPTSVGAACFTEVGNGRWTASDRIRLGGLDIVPSGAITVDQHALRITAKGDVDVQLNALGETVTLYHGALDWSFNASLRIDIHINVASEVEGFPIEG